MYGLETESSVESFGSRTFFFENIGKHPVGKGVGQADAVCIALDNVGSFRKKIMGIVSGGWTGTPFRKMDFYVWEGTVFHQVPDPGKIHKCGLETAGAAACHRRAVSHSACKLFLPVCTEAFCSSSCTDAAAPEVIEGCSLCGQIEDSFFYMIFPFPFVGEPWKHAVLYRPSESR